MKLIADYSDYSYGIGTNPAGGGRIVVRPETPEEEQELLRNAYQNPGRYGRENFIVKCRSVSHAGGVPHDDGLNPYFVELVHRYGWRVKGYPEFADPTAGYST